MFPTPLIGSDNALALLAVVAVAIAVSWRLAQTGVGAALSPAPILIIIMVALSNVGVIPFSAEAYGFVASYLLPCGVAMLLLNVDLRASLRISRMVAASFALGLFASACGIALALAVASPGELARAVAALYAAVLSGGMVNLLSVGEATGVFAEHPGLLAAIIAGSVPLDIAYLAIMAQLARIGPVMKAFADRGRAEATPAEKPATPAPVAASPYGTALALALALALVALAKAIAAVLGQPHLMIVVLGAMSVLVANVFPRLMRSLGPTQPLALWLLFAFLATVTAGADLSQLTQVALQVAAFVAVLYVTHIFVLLSGGWLLRLPLPALVVGSLAGVAGASTTAVIAASQKWDELVLPGAVCASIGLATGTYVGLIVFAVL